MMSGIVMCSQPTQPYRLQRVDWGWFDWLAPLALSSRVHPIRCYLCDRRGTDVKIV